MVSELYIAELENDDVGKVGEIIMQQFCIHTNIAEIDGLKTKNWWRYW